MIKIVSYLDETKWEQLKALAEAIKMIEKKQKEVDK